MDMALFLVNVKEKANNLTDDEIKYWQKQYDQDVDVYYLPEDVDLAIHPSLKCNNNS